MDPIKQEYDLDEQQSRRVCEILGVEYTGTLRILPAPALTRAMIAATNGKPNLAVAHFVEHLTNLPIEERDVLEAQRVFGTMADFPLPLDASTYTGTLFEKGWERIAQYSGSELIGYVDEGHGVASVIAKIALKSSYTYMDLGKSLEPHVATVLCAYASRIANLEGETITVFTRDHLSELSPVEPALGSEEDIAMLVEMVLDIAVEIREDGTHFTYTPTVIKDVVENVLETGIGLSIVERRRAKGRVIQKLRDDDIHFTEPVVDAFFNDLDLQLG